jgi:hypothetical protein
MNILLPCRKPDQAASMKRAQKREKPFAPTFELSRLPAGASRSTVVALLLVLAFIIIVYYPGVHSCNISMQLY